MSVKNSLFYAFLYLVLRTFNSKKGETKGKGVLKGGADVPVPSLTPS